VPALEPVEAWRVVAAPAAVDSARWSGEVVDVLRIAPDEALGIGAIGVTVDDPDGIVEPEAGFVVALLDSHQLTALAAHVDWPMPTPAGALAQGKIGGVPSKVLVGEPSLVVTNAAYADELARRLGW
jgi:hypothetical protein